MRFQFTPITDVRFRFTLITDVRFRFTRITDVRFRFIPITDVRFRFGRITYVRFRFTRITDVRFLFENFVKILKWEVAVSKKLIFAMLKNRGLIRKIVPTSDRKSNFANSISGTAATYQ